MKTIGRKKAEKLAERAQSTGDYKTLDMLRSDYPRLKVFRVKNDDPGLHLQIQALHNTSEKAESGLTGKQLRKESKAIRHAKDGVTYKPLKLRKLHVGRRAKAKIAAKLAREAN